jgi:carbamoyl-phosphate synthase large subunit
VNSSRSERANQKITVLVTAIGGVGFGEQILKALRIAGGYGIIGTDTNPFCTNFKLVERAFTVPVATDPAYLDAVLSISRAHGVAAVFPGCEPELRRMSAERKCLLDADLFLPIDLQEVIEVGMDKRVTAAFLDAQGFAHPRFASVTADDLAEIDWFPVVVKPAVGGGGSADCYLAQTPRELALLAELLGERWPQMMVQEYVGRADAEFTVGVLHDLDGKYLNSIAVHRELDGALNVRLRVPNVTERRDLGETLVISSGFSHGLVGPFPEVTRQCERIAAALEVRGAVNIQCRLVDGRVQVFEINPRFSGTTSLRAMVGYNEPDVLLRKHVLGEHVEPGFSYGSGRIHRGLTESFIPDEPAPDWRTTLS